MDADPAAALAVPGPQAADPGDQRRDAVGPVARRDHGPELDQRVPAGIALPVAGSTTPDGDLDLDHRLEPVDVRTLEQADLDQAHGPGRIAGRQRLDSAPWMASIPPTLATPLPELDASDAAVTADLPAYLRDLERLVQHRLRELHRRRASTRWRRWAAGASRGSARVVEACRPGRPARRHRRSRRSRGEPGGPRSLLIGHIDTVFDPGRRPSARSGSTDGSPGARA